MSAFPRWLRHGLVIMVAVAWFADFLGTLFFKLPTNAATQTVFVLTLTAVLGLEGARMIRSRNDGNGNGNGHG